VTEPRSVPVLSRSAHDRIAHRRSDDEWLAKAWAAETTRVLVLAADGTVAVTPSPSLLLRAAAEVDAEFGTAGDRVLLGELDGVTYFALLAGEVSTPQWRGLRALAVRLDELEVGLMVAAVALQEWHRRHLFCPRCGTATVVAQAGWTRRCPADGSEHFPRTDPAVIMLVHDGAGRIVLGRGHDWAPGRMSVLAGFVEAGESAEAAVEREVFEEVGIRVKNVQYVASQPHPFPASWMLGFTAELDGDPTLSLETSEIAEAGWFTRVDVRMAATWGDEDKPGGPPADAVLRGLPSPMSIARQLVNIWLAEA